MQINQTLVLDKEGLELKRLEIGQYHLTLSVSTTVARAECPVCGHLSNRVHSRYTRTVSDLSDHTSDKARLHSEAHSWLNKIEPWFSILARKLIKVGLTQGPSERRVFELVHQVVMEQTALDSVNGLSTLVS
jgi:hypothetical protein